MGLFDPRIDKHLIADQGEVVIDEVRKHGAAIVGAACELVGGFVLLLLVFVVPVPAWWLPVVVGMGVMLHAAWRILGQRMDRFVITNMRVFRVHGILTQRIATMPLSRILDISVYKPVVGRMLGFGHFVFESAAQEQGLREIRFVGDPDERGLTIQRVIQQAGLRGSYTGQPGTMPQRPQPPQEPAEAVAPEPRPTIEDAREAERPPAGWEWLELARSREAQRLAQLRGDFPTGPIPVDDPHHSTTAPIDLTR